MQRGSIPAWQWLILFLVFSGAFLFGWLAWQSFQQELQSGSLIEALLLQIDVSGKPGTYNHGSKESTLFRPTLLPSSTPTLTFTPTITSSPTFTLTPSATPTLTSTPTPTPTSTPEWTNTPDLPPSSSSIQGFIGYTQSYALSCESRSAVDLAAFFGLSISEVDFQAGLPISDDPDLGFVGVPWGLPGQIPPYSYGVHAAPVAALLRAYGLPARDHVDLSFETIQREIAAGHPVMVWVITGLSSGYTVEYTVPSSGRVTRVAYNEHTMIVIGYSETMVTVQDGAWAYSVSKEQFLRSWSSLGNMAITVEK